MACADPTCATASWTHSTIAGQGPSGLLVYNPTRARMPGSLHAAPGVLRERNSHMQPV